MRDHEKARPMKIASCEELRAASKLKFAKLFLARKRFNLDIAPDVAKAVNGWRP